MLEAYIVCFVLITIPMFLASVIFTPARHRVRK